MQKTDASNTLFNLAADLVNHRQDLDLRAPDEGREPVEGDGQAQEGPAHPDADGDQEEREGKMGQIAVAERQHAHQVSQPQSK